MFQLLQPGWMWAAAGIMIPVVIHLWNRKKGKVLKVGSIALLTQNPKQPARSFRLEDLLLLILRCVLILLIAVVLSQPLWLEEQHPEKGKGWIMMERKGVAETYTRFKPQIDSLLQAQYEVHYFEPGFEKVDTEIVHQAKKDSLPVSSLSYWSILRSLDEQVPAKLPVYLFTTNNLQRFRGRRPQVHMNLKWLSYTPQDSVSTWLAGAYAISADSIRMVMANSDPSGTRFPYKNVLAAPQQTTDYSLHTDGRRILADYKKSEPVVVDTATLNVGIYTDQYAHDAGYLKAAIEAIQQFSRRKIRVTEVRDPLVPAKQDWVFWLSEKPVQLQSAQHMVVYEKGKPEAVRTFLVPSDDNPDASNIDVYKRIAYKHASKRIEAVWQDGYGAPLLALENNGTSIYHFYSRFDPSWSDLTWSAAFPQMLERLIFSAQDTIMGCDMRIMESAQLQPEIAAADKSMIKEKLVLAHDLSKGFWLAAFLVFFAERVVTYRTKKEKSNA